MGRAKRILIVDDEPQVVGLLRAVLEAENFDVAEARDGAALRAALGSNKFDLITLDLGLPGYSGVDIARDLCRTTDTPIVVVSGRSDEYDRVLALELGADDFIQKPFSTREFAARVRAVLRRAEGAPRMVAAAVSQTLRFHGFTLNMQTRRLLRASGGELDLTVAECRLLEILCANAGRACSRDEITMHIKGYPWSPPDRSLDTLVTRLRRKIETRPERPEIIMNVRGVGYMMTSSPAPQ